MKNDIRMPSIAEIAGRSLAVLVVAVVAMLGGVGTASAQFAIDHVDGIVVGDDGTTYTQAGGHPASGSLDVAVTTFVNPDFGTVEPYASPKNILVDLPAGLVGNPLATPVRCTEDALITLNGLGNPSCPSDAQIGTVVVEGTAGPSTVPLYNMAPRDGVPGTFGFNVQGVPVHIDARVRPEDYGLSVDVTEINQAIAFFRSEVRLWGVPAAARWDAQRMPCLAGGSHPVTGQPCSTDTPPRAFLTNPTRCTDPGVGLETVVRADSWESPGVFDQASFFSHRTAPEENVQQGPTGCDVVPFDPSVEFEPTVARPDSPTGLDMSISIPQSGTSSASGLASAHLKDVKVTLPEGMTISPAAADGLSGCSDAQIQLGSDRPVACPAASKVGTVEAVTPLLEETLEGSIYIGSQESSDPASGKMFRLFLVLANEERGIDVRLEGAVRADPATGRLETTFVNNPQLPVSEISLRLKSGSRAPLATPPTCGQKTVVTELTSWARPDEPVVRTDSFSIDCPGAAGFAPTFGAGVRSPVAGAFSSLAVQIEREDRQQYLSGVSVDLPEGLTAKLRGVALCASAQADAGGCPAGSRIGSATVGSGPGATPFFLKGDVYLTEGYKGGPYGLAVHVPVKAGPFDLGWVRVRQALYVDAATAKISVVSDPLPQIVKGVPVRLRSIDVDVDRPGFTIAPTSCSEKRVGAALTSIDGAVHRTSARFQVGDCAGLDFKPKLAMRLSGAKQRRTGGHPGLRAVLTQGAGQANIGAVKVTLPRSIALDPANANGLCDYEVGLKVAGGAVGCPASSVIGRATAYTPLLGKPLTGKVYFVEHKQRSKQGNLISKLPSLLVALRGEVNIDLRARTAVRNGRLVNTFPQVPDAPVSKFDLRLKGGNGGILTVTRSARRTFDVCKGRHVAAVETDGHNGKRADYGVLLASPCAKQAKSKKAKRKTSKTQRS